ncbi:MAG TPA: 50S ribosomal protein L24 [Spirochaetota bacterium]|nr:50S ribosomal protein L24 [Spirochaetota bacterium]
MVRTRLKKNDEVMVIAGSDKGKRGKVLVVDTVKGRVLVEGVNKKTKHVKATQDNPKGGILHIEKPVAVSNVLFYCDKCKKGVRLGVQSKDEKKIRVCRKCGKSLD